MIQPFWSRFNGKSIDFSTKVVSECLILIQMERPLVPIHMNPTENIGAATLFCGPSSIQVEMTWIL